MCYSDYLPVGSVNDPKAPWNASDDLCRYCDEEQIRDEYAQNHLNEDIDDSDIDDYLDNFSLCKQCYKETQADNI